MGMKSRWACGVLAALLAIGLNACVSSKNGAGASSTTGFMWVTTQGDQMVSAFNINLSTGAVSKAGKSVATGISPTAVAITPDNGILFVANAGDTTHIGTVNAYTVASDGSLTALASANVGESPMGLAMDPNGAFLFVANQGVFSDPTSGTVSVLKFSGSTFTTVATVSTAGPGAAVSSGPVALTVDPSGKFLYVANEVAGTVSAFSYDSNGQLTELTPNSPYSVGANPSALAFSRTVSGSNRDYYLFVTNFASDTVNIFKACVVVSLTCPTTPPAGLLTPVASVGAGSGPAGIVVDPALDFVYVLERKSSQVSEFTFSPATGGLSSLSSTASVSGSPFSAAITSDGSWVFVSNNSGSNLNEFAVGANGVLNIPTTSSIILSGLPSAVLIK
jgi:DNA-binding beta-propeller fold protein YncE